MTQQLTATQVEQTERDEMIERARAFGKWLNKGKQFRTVGHNIAWIRQNHPQPHKFDEYELKRAIEEGLV